jgi:hypothetical protein
VRSDALHPRVERPFPGAVASASGKPDYGWAKADGESRRLKARDPLKARDSAESARLPLSATAAERDCR